MKVDWDELKRLHEASKQGEWSWYYNPKFSSAPVSTLSPNGVTINICNVTIPYIPHKSIELCEANAACIAALHNSFPAILAEREAAQRFINHVEGEVACYLGSGDDGVIGDANVLRAVTIMHKRKMAADNFYRRIKEISESGDCGKMLEDAIAAFDKETQNEG